MGRKGSRIKVGDVVVHWDSYSTRRNAGMVLSTDLDDRALLLDLETGGMLWTEVLGQFLILEAADPRWIDDRWLLFREQRDATSTEPVQVFQRTVPPNEGRTSLESWLESRRWTEGLDYEYARIVDRTLRIEDPDQRITGIEQDLFLGRRGIQTVSLQGVPIEALSQSMGCYRTETTDLNLDDLDHKWASRFGVLAWVLTDHEQGIDGVEIDGDVIVGSPGGTYEILDLAHGNRIKLSADPVPALYALTKTAKGYRS